jgi:hypothetical protein
MHDEMPGFFPGRPGGEHDEPLLDMLLERRPLPPGAPPPLHDLARMLAAAAGPAESGDLAGEDAARAAFRRRRSPAGVSHAAPRSARHRLTARPARGRLPLAAALAVAAAGLGSATAAYAGALPSPIQHIAHEYIGAPPPHYDLSQSRPVIISSSPVRASRTSAPRARQTRRVPASPTPLGNSHLHSKYPRYTPGSSFASCQPAPAATQNQGHPAPTPSASHPRPSPGASSLGPHQSHPGHDRVSPWPSASGWTPVPAGTDCPALPVK